MEKLLIQIDGLAVLLHFPKGKCSAEAVKIWRPWTVEKFQRKVAIEITTHRVSNLTAFNTRRFFKGCKRVFFTLQSFEGIGRRGEKLIGKIYSKKGISARWLYYTAVEPLLHHLMRKHNFFPMHGAGLARGESAVLVLGKSGAGKSTTSSFLLQAGLEVLSDDDIIVSLKNEKAKALGAEKGIFVKDSTLERFPELKSMKNGAWVRKPDGVKRMLVPVYQGHRNGRFRSERIQTIVFPEVNPHKKSRLIRLNPREAFLQLLEQRPNVWPDYMEDKKTVKKIFQLYQTLSRQAVCYRLTLGCDVSAIKKNIARLADIH